MTDSQETRINTCLMGQVWTSVMADDCVAPVCSLNFFPGETNFLTRGESSLLRVQQV